MSGVATQPIMILVMVLQLMLCPPLAMPMPIMAPMTACELETGTNGMVGSPKSLSEACSHWEEKANKTNDWEKTIIHAIVGVMDIRLLPTVLMALWE